ncbi:hypothetical protein [Aliiroseovarius sp. YM-037]|uniref:hypothetical protein n=1 Tax=Aliiroseovarius sp. YM-037 TaxID=3341728 RepID=UPI003A8106B1
MKKLISFIPHPPSFEICTGLLFRLHQRGNVAVEAIVGKRLIKTDPRILPLFERSGMPFKVASPIGLELLSLPRMLRADAVLAHTDPVAYYKRIRPRDTVIPKMKVPLIFMQHGMNQLSLNYTRDNIIKNYYAQKFLLWDDLPSNMKEITHEDIRPRSSVVGFQKKNLLPAFPGAAEMTEICAAYRQIVLICHNYGSERLHDGAKYTHARDYMGKMVAANPDRLFILRSHRSRNLDGHKDLDTDLAETFDNVLLSDRHSGPLKWAGVHDVMDHADMVISHPSTVVLDAVYRKLPLAIIDTEMHRIGENADKIAHLPVISDADSAQAFLDGETWRDEMFQPILDRYGPDLDTNIDRAAVAVEEFLNR